MGAVDLSKYQQMIMDHKNVQAAIGMFAPDGFYQDGMTVTAGRFKMFDPREWQKQPIEDLIANKSIIVQAPVGSGKSIVLQNAIAMSRRVSYIIMPTIALALDMRDRFKDLGANVEVWSSVSTKAQKDEVIKNIDDYHAIILAPESMATVPVSKGGILIVDECHNISMSVGYRSSFSLIGKFMHKISARCVGLFSATINEEIINDMRRQFFGVDFNEYRQKNPDRENLKYHTPIDKGYSMNLIYSLLEENSKAGRSAIVYAFTRKHIDGMHMAMKRKLDGMGYTTIPYHSKIKNKDEALTRFMDNKSCVFATSAFGEGIDKKDVGLIIRIGYPFSITQLVQEAGRAERGGDRDGNYYMFRLGDEKRMFDMNCYKIRDIERVFSYFSQEEYRDIPSKNYISDIPVVTFLELENILSVKTENKAYYEMDVTGKDSTKRDYHHLLHELKKKKKWFPDEIAEIDDQWKKYIKNAKTSGYLKYTSPSSKKTWKLTVSRVPDDMEDKMKIHNEKVMKDYHEINEFFESDDKKKYLKDYFEEK